MAFRALGRRDLIILSVFINCFYVAERLYHWWFKFYNFFPESSTDREKFFVPSVKNIAFGKTANQSSTLGNFSASRAIDGDVRTFSHTNDNDAWLEIDMGDVYPINYVAIANRWCIDPSDVRGCLCRLSGVKLLLIDDHESLVATGAIGNACDLREVTVDFDANCSTATQSNQLTPGCLPFAQKLKLQSTTGQPISVFEVQVFSSGTSTVQQNSYQLAVFVQNNSVHMTESSNTSRSIASYEHSNEEKVTVKSQEKITLMSQIWITHTSSATKVLIDTDKPIAGNKSSSAGEPSLRVHNSTQTEWRESNDTGRNHSNVKVHQKTDAEQSITQRVHNFHSDGNTTNATTAVNIGNKYLLFYNHDGFSNQIFGLKGAISMAAKMGRTLILPPITPHKTVDTRTLKYPLGYRGHRDDPCNKTFKTVMADIGMVAGGTKFPEWSELFNFTFDGRNQEFHGTAHLGMLAIELPDFFRRNVTQIRFDEVEMLCNNLPYPVLDFSKDKIESSSQVAYVGSMFERGFKVHVPFWKSSRKMFDILQHIYGRVQSVSGGGGRSVLLRQDYVGLHVRVDDNTMNEDKFNCESQEFIKKFGSNRHLLWRYFNQGRVIFLGTSSKTIKECVISIATAYY